MSCSQLHSINHRLWLPTVSHIHNFTSVVHNPYIIICCSIRWYATACRGIMLWSDCILRCASVYHIRWSYIRETHICGYFPSSLDAQTAYISSSVVGLNIGVFLLCVMFAIFRLQVYFCWYVGMGVLSCCLVVGPAVEYHSYRHIVYKKLWLM